TRLTLQATLLYYCTDRCVPDPDEPARAGVNRPKQRCPIELRPFHFSVSVTTITRDNKHRSPEPVPATDSLFYSRRPKQSELPNLFGAHLDETSGSLKS